MLAVLARTLVYATLFIGFLLVFLPAQLLNNAGIAGPRAVGAGQVLGVVICLAGTALALWCIGTFVLVGRGTPAPFDPPRRLVVRGPYAFVRNPMYIGAGAALLGAALYYESAALAIYAAGFLVVMHAFVVLYEEPALRRTFGADYEAYTARVRRWTPVIRGR